MSYWQRGINHNEDMHDLLSTKNMEMKYIQENLIEKQLDRSVVAVDSLTYL